MFDRLKTLSLKALFWSSGESLGVAVLSTNQGLMTDREARKRRVGGEVLCYVW